MSELKMDENKKNEILEILKKNAEKMKLAGDNMEWIMSLPEAEKIMVGEYRSNLRKQLLNVPDDERAKILNAASLYSKIIIFYSTEIETIHREQEIGITRLHYEFDPKLTKEEAFKKYTGYTEEEAKKYSEICSHIDDEIEKKVKEVREKYTGDLASQLDVSREEYEQKAKELTKGLAAIARGFAENMSAVDISEYAAKLDQYIRESSEKPGIKM